MRLYYVHPLIHKTSLCVDVAKDNGIHYFLGSEEESI